MDYYLIFAYILAYIGILASCFYIINIFFYYKKKAKEEEDCSKRVSIMIPAFNEENGIASTIKSALNLDYPKNLLEIIVVDDGSKDRTYEIAKRFEKDKRVKVYKKLNGGKASALNFALKKARGEIVVSMDADTFAKPDSLKKMVAYFKDNRVMCVAPSMGVYKPKSIWGRILQIEYYMGVFLRKSFASMNAIHVTPGAFSAYRRRFFEKYGTYEVGNITEDLEVALRIQSHYYIIENAEKASIYTSSPDSFKELLYQRRRWYIGLMKNLWRYRRLFGFKHGPLGYLVLPVAVSTIALSVFLTFYMIVRLLDELRTELISLNSINFRFDSFFEINSFLFERLFYTILSKPIFIFAFLFVILVGFYVYFSKKQMLYKENIRLNFILFVVFYSFLFAFWWAVSILYVIFNRKISWRTRYDERTQ